LSVRDSLTGQGKKIVSPTELETGDFIRIRGRILGSGKIGKRPGVIVLGVGVLLIGAIAYGVTQSGVRSPIGLGRRSPVTIASASNSPWWQQQSDAVHAALPAQTPPPIQTSPTLPSGVPDLSQVDDGSLVTVERSQHTSTRSFAAAAYPIADLPPIPRIVDPQQGVPLPPSDVPMRYDPVKPHPNAQDPTLQYSLNSPLLVRDAPRGVELLAAPPTPRHPAVDLPVPPPQGSTVAMTAGQTSPFSISAGTIIPAALITAIDSDLPGLLVAEVRQNTYDTMTGRYLLIPQGAKIVGLYDSRISYGQDRLLVSWQRLILPNGSNIELQNMAGADLAGRSGFDARVDNHTKKLFRGAILLSIIGAGAQLSQPPQPNANSSAPTVGQVVASNVGGQIANTATQMTQRQLNVAPNLRVPTGYQFDVVVDHEIAFVSPYVEP
jgi:type IV secretory pathway VirB10-like protein